MKTPPLRLLAVALSLFSLLHAAPPNETTVERWGVFELTLTGPAEGNPFVDVELSATFTQGERAVHVGGFYDGEGTYKVRFSPDTTGEWRYLTRSNRPALDAQTGGFTATPPAAGNHGPVRVANTFHFAYADGTPYRQLGTTSYSWIHQTPERMDQTLRTLAGAPFNKLRMCVFPQAHATPTHFVFPRNAAGEWDFDRFDPAFFRLLEQRVGELRGLNIEADLILFHPYGGRWPFSTLDAARDDRYVRYLVARLAAYRNVWWSLCNEWDFLTAKTEADWDRIFQVIAAADPYVRLRSIHNGFKHYNHNQPWVTHASVQQGVAALDPERAVIYRDVWRKPVVFDEVRYEGNHHRRWGQLRAEELVLRFWSGTVAGTYVGHSEILGPRVAPGATEWRKPDRAVGYWLGAGGELRGDSVARLAFLRGILAAAPPEGIEPIDKWQDWRLGGKAGEYYLFYFGQQAPAEWKFLLPRHGLVDGVQFSAEIIDTWNMTITPVEGLFTVQRRDDYTFVEQAGRGIPLPARPYLALRLRRVGEPPAGVKEKEIEL